jgi:capsular exopolysaccharide synthesis family protein
VVADFITAIDVEHVKNGPLIKVTFSDKNKTVAQTGAHALISAYYKLHGNGDDAQEVEDKVAFLTNRIADQDRILLQAKRQLELLAKQAGTTDLTTRDNAIQGKLTDAEGQYYNARNAYEAAVSAANGKQVAVKPDKEFVYAQIAAADHLMQIKLSNRDDARSELRDLSVQFGPNSTVFKRAQMRLNDTEDAVNAYATRFLASNQGRMDLQLEGGSDAGNLDALKRTSEHLAKMVDDYRQQAAETSSEHQHMDELKARIENATAQRDTDQKTIDDVQAKMALTKPVNIVSYGDEATLSGDKRKIVAAVGFLFGGFIPVGLIMLYGMVENRFRFSDDATGTDLAGVTLLGILPNLPDRLSDPQQAGIAAHCVHQIRTMLQISRINDEPQVVAITSASTGDGKTSLTLALGLSYAACGARALLIDCDLLAAGLTHRLNVNSADGVLEAVANRALLEYVRTTDIADVAILPVGTTHSHHASTLSPVSLRRLLSEAKKNFDIIIVDTGPILGSIEASLVCAAADRTILAIARNQQRPLVEKSIEHLQAIGAHLAGVVFNRAHARDFEQSMSGVGLRSRTALAKSKDAA